jgi:hypothetical protein
MSDIDLTNDAKLCQRMENKLYEIGIKGSEKTANATIAGMFVMIKPTNHCPEFRSFLKKIRDWHCNGSVWVFLSDIAKGQTHFKYTKQGQKGCCATHCFVF